MIFTFARLSAWVPLSDAFALHDAATWFMTGLIWIVQLLQYPMFSAVSPSMFPRTHARHVTRITILVAPAMIVEFSLAALLALRMGRGNAPAIIGFGLVLVNWFSTALIMVPLHDRLAAGKDVARNLVLLVRWNWLRTIAWSARALICLLWLGR